MFGGPWGKFKLEDVQRQMAQSFGHSDAVEAVVRCEWHRLEDEYEWQHGYRHSDHESKVEGG
jgi:hypothetical protein